ncbi:formyltransferase family protein [Hydrogenophaga sp.]|uniref:formyltransferase family protein n=1 Tax=Hydrogenophaga sp. TaxID=1904254 RepID=UPI0027249E33|nr:formyltransferase family protein [Hydrogenophaga sp.]MDO9438422.1 formyltransferase family protein [Hydrogenophaga sp.]
MKISILCSSEKHPINPMLSAWAARHAEQHDVVLVRAVGDLPGGDILFLISCTEIVSEGHRNLYRKTLVIHASDLPEGRGWSPHIWQILAGRSTIKVTLLEAVAQVDAGDIWHQIDCEIPRTALWDDINKSLFNAELELMDFAVAHFHTCQPRQQDPTTVPTYHSRRTPADSEIDPVSSIEAQFDALRVADPERFPAFFHLRGATYRIRLERIEP